METRGTDWNAGLGNTRNILVHPDERNDHAAICRAFYSAIESPQSVVVSYEQSIEEWLSDHQRTALESVVFVSVGETVRSTAATSPTETPMPPAPLDDPVLDGIGDPTDLAELGLRIQSALRTFRESEDGDIVVCVDSVSALVEAVSLRRAFRFLHILTRLIDAYGVTAHYHYDASLPAKDLDTLRVLFDAELDTHNSLDTSVWTLDSRPRPSAD